MVEIVRVKNDTEIEGIRLLKAAEWYPDYDKINEPFETLVTQFDRELLNKLHLHF